MTCSADRALLTHDPTDVRGYATRVIVRVVASVAVARANWFWIAAVWTGEPRIMERLKSGDLCWFSPRIPPDLIPDYERQILEGFVMAT